MNELSVTERDTILGLLRLGWSQRRIERETGHRRETVAAYGIAAGLLTPKPAKVATDPGSPIDEPLATAGAPAASTTVERSRSNCEVHRPFIEAEAAKGRNAVAIFQELVEHHGYVGAYNAVKRFVRKLNRREPQAKCRFETAPGAEMQVDYGQGAKTRHPVSGKYRRPWLFVMTLGFSRHTFRKAVWESSSQTWCELHEEAFAYFGGACQTIRLDNLREGVVDPDLYDPKLNQLYAAMLKHYSVVALPCRPYAPDLKGKVESAVGHTQSTALKGKTFETIEEQNAQLFRWNERWAFTRIHGTVRRQVREMFAEEQPALQPLPTTRFEYYRVVQRRVHLDGHVEIDRAYYSVPPRYCGTTVVVHVGRLWLRILDPYTQTLVREHEVTQRGKRRTNEADRPKQTPPKIDHLVERLARHGPACGVFARSAVDEHGATAARMLFGVLDLVRRYGPRSVEHACEVAAHANSLRYRFLRTYLAHHASTQPLIARHNVVAEIDTYTNHLSAIMQGDAL